MISTQYSSCTYRTYAAAFNTLATLDVMLCDEGHRLKNAYGTSTTLALGNCCAVRRLLLTGKQSTLGLAEQGRAATHFASCILFFYSFTTSLLPLPPPAAPPPTSSSPPALPPSLPLTLLLPSHPPPALSPSLPPSHPLTQPPSHPPPALPPSLSPSTGTPIQNNLDELYSVVHFVAPGYLGELVDFQRTFSDHISKGQLHGASELHRKKVRVVLKHLLFLLLQCNLDISCIEYICLCFYAHLQSFSIRCNLRFYFTIQVT